MTLTIGEIIIIGVFMFGLSLMIYAQGRLDAFRKYKAVMVLNKGKVSELRDLLSIYATVAIEVVGADNFKNLIEKRIEQLEEECEQIRSNAVKS